VEKFLESEACVRKTTMSQDYVIENIVDHKWNDGSTILQVKWKNFPPSDNTWEKEEDVKAHNKKLYRRYMVLFLIFFLSSLFFPFMKFKEN